MSDVAAILMRIIK